MTHFQRLPISGYQSMERLHEDIRAHLPADISVSVRTNRFRSYGIFRRIYDVIAAKARESGVNHITGDAHYLTYFLKKNRTILTIHDCIPLRLLTGLKRKLYFLFWLWLPEKRSRVIVTVSNSTRRQVLRYLRCDPSKVKTIYCSLSPEFSYKPKVINVKSPHFLHLGTSNNKNLERHVQALKGLSCSLTVIGKLQPNDVLMLEKSGVRYTNLVGLTRSQVLEQYEACDVLLFASTYEGFGLPIIEAQAVGRPVITSNLWSMPEVAGKGACLVNPFDVRDIKKAIDRLLRDQLFRETLITEGITNVARFRAEEIARQYAQLYREVRLA